MVSRSCLMDPLKSAPVTRGTPAFGWSRTTRKIGIANTANSTPATKKMGSGLSVIPSNSSVTAAKIVPM